VGMRARARARACVCVSECARALDHKLLLSKFTNLFVCLISKNEYPCGVNLSDTLHILPCTREFFDTCQYLLYFTICTCVCDASP